MEPRRERNVQVVVFVVFALATAAQAVAVITGGMASVNELAAGAMLFALVVASRLFPLHIGYKRKMLTDSGSLFAAALILQPWLAGIVAGGGMATAELISQRSGQRSLKQLVFNSSQRLLSVIAATIAFHALANEPLNQPGLSVAIASGAAVVAMFAVNDLLLLGVIFAQVGRSILKDWLVDRSDIPYDIALYASGFVVALAASFHLLLLPLLIFPVAVFHRAMRTQVTLRTQTREAVEALADVVDMRDPYTFQHSHRVADFARGICIHLGLSQDIVEEIAAAARVHDVGKIGVRDAVLLKAGPLTDEEYAEIKQHPVIGANLTARFPDFGRGTAYIRHHHERWDGRGYPAGLKEEQIPLGARVIAVADTFDALTSTRVYRPALTEEVARAELARVAGTQLDPEAVAAFFAYKGWAFNRAEAVEARPVPVASTTPA